MTRLTKPGLDPPADRLVRRGVGQRDLDRRLAGAVAAALAAGVLDLPRDVVVQLVAAAVVGHQLRIRPSHRRRLPGQGRRGDRLLGRGVGGPQLQVAAGHAGSQRLDPRALVPPSRCSTRSISSVATSAW